MTDTKRTVGNLILFGGAVFLSGWVGLLTDRLTGQPAPTSLNDYLTGGELPRLVLPFLTVVALRAVVGGWRDAGFAPNLRGAGATYLLLILAYPTALAVATIPMFLCWTVFYTEAFRATRSIWSGVITQVFVNAVILRQFAAEIASPNLIVLGLLPAAFLCVIGLLVGRATTTPAQNISY